MYQEKDSESKSKKGSFFNTGNRTDGYNENNSNINKINQIAGNMLRKLKAGYILYMKEITDLLKILPINDSSLVQEYQNIIVENNQFKMENFCNNLFNMNKEWNIICDVVYINFQKYSSLIRDICLDLGDGSYLDDEEDDYKTVSVHDKIKELLNVASLNGDELNEELKIILGKKDVEEAKKFFLKLPQQNHEKNCKNAKGCIFDIMKIYIWNAGVILPAEIRQSVVGNLFVPKNAKFVKRQKDRPNDFSGEIKLVNASNNSYSRLERYFDELVNEPFKTLMEKMSAYDLSDSKFSNEKAEFENYFGIEFKEDMFNISSSFYNMIDKMKNVILPDLASFVDIVNDKTKNWTPDDFYYNTNTNKNFICNTLEKHLKNIKDATTSTEITNDLVKIIQYLYLYNIIEINQGEKFLPQNSFYDLSEFWDLKKKSINEIAENKLSGLSFLLRSAAEPLFMHEPSVNDIQQTNIGDCYLLAALISLVNSPKYGPDFIMNMMRDNGNGTVTVKLYRPSSDPSNSEIDKNGNVTSLHEIFVNVDKHGLINNQKSSLWVQILEQAYAIIGGNFLFYKLDGIYNNTYSDYLNLKNQTREITDIEGGRNVTNAFMSLTGDLSYCYYSNVEFFGNRNFRSLDYYSNQNGGIINFIKKALDNKLPVTIGFKDEFYALNNCKVFKKHGYSIEKINNKNMHLINPHSNNKFVVCKIEDVEKNLEKIDICGEV